jgi:hypothetical protein
MSSLGSDIFREIVRNCYYEMKIPRNEKKIKYIINNITKIVLQDFRFQINIVVAILVLMFIMNCVQFYFYIFHFKKFL